MDAEGLDLDSALAGKKRCLSEILRSSFKVIVTSSSSVVQMTQWGYHEALVARAGIPGHGRGSENAGKGNGKRCQAR